MKKSILLMLFALLILSACNFPSKTKPNPNQVDTQVALLLTTMPTATIYPTPVSTQIPPSPTVSIASTQTQSPTVTTTPTLPPTSTLSPSDPSQAYGTPSWTNPSDWKGFYLSPQDPEIQISQSNGSLELTAVNPNGWHGWSLTFIKAANFFLEGTFKIGDCSGLDRYGLVFRAPDTTQGYFFGISCDGEYSLRKWISGGFSDTDIISWTKSPDILAGAGQVNRLGVMVSGDQYSLYANGKLLGSASDDLFVSEGIYGAYIASVNTPALTVTVQSMRLWNLP